MSLDDPQRDLIVAVDAPPSPSSSTSSINDDNPMGRVYFGPLQSPEKKYVAKAARTRTPPPVRRSPRLSAAPQMSHSRSASPSEVEEEAVLVALGDARQTESASDEDGTPENDRAGQDDMEPSSALASKITRAHDNPSPPPRMQGLQPPDDDSTPASPSPRLIDISPSPEKEVSGATPRSNLPPPIFPSMPLDPPIPSSPLPVSVPNGAEARADLISFDIAGTPTQSTSRVSPSRNTPTPAQTQSVNLLSPSPVRAWTRPFPEDSSATGLSIQPDRVDKGKGRAVDPEHTLQPATDSTKSETVHALTPVRATTLLSVAPPSTLRRSPRLERASPSPGKAPLPSLGMMPSLDVGTSRKASPPKPSSRPVSPSRRSPDAAAKKAQLAAARLGSLSPNSNGVLANLLTTAAELMTGSEQPHESPVLPSFLLPPNTGELPSTPRRPSASPQVPPTSQKTRTIYDVLRPPLPQTASRATNDGSPLRFPVNLNDPARTPARRIPIEHALKSGQKPRLPGLFGGPVFNRQALDDPTRSPARRVAVPPALTSPLKQAPSSARTRSPERLQGPLASFKTSQTRIPPAPPSLSPARPIRSGSAEPQLQSPKKTLGFPKPPSRAVSDSEIPSPSKPRSILPFPVRAGSGLPSQLPTSIPEEREPVASSSRLPTAPVFHPSPAKPGSRQPSAASGSRIPRIGSKPYSRPQGSLKPGNKLLEANAKRAAVRPVLPKPGRLVQVASTSGAEDSATHLKHPAAARDARIVALPERERPTIGRLVQSAGGSGSSSEDVVAGQSSSSPLKRKRDLEDITSPTNGTVTRKLGPRVIDSKPPQSKSMVATSRVAPGPAAAKRPRVLQVRRVADKHPSAPAPPANDKPLEYTEDSRPRESSPVAEPSPIEYDVPDVQASSPKQDSPSRAAASTSDSSLRGSSDEISSSPVAPDGMNGAGGEMPSTSRRVTRSGRTPQIASDVFGSTQRLPSRRKSQRNADDSDAFSSMSATALKALTNSNTTRNQHYVIVLETEVIRMTGSRPESPTTKVRTVLEKQKEDKARGRKERAERRARRSSSSGLDGDEGDEGDGGDSADLSMMSSDDFDAMGPNGQPLRHRRGAGEEEDFMTPDRPDRPAKRARLGSVEREEEGDREAKRVRWDRGLFKTIYFEVGKLELDGTERAKSLPPTPNPKGALAGSAKALRLDSLGNLVNCSSPLKDVVPENVTVKKFVYDSDVVEEEPPPKPVSKGKGKRAKSI